ncbi:MAG TPA: hypothetical protein VEX37_14690 [Thermomicrobiales bacterium]|nr:hypothetical protein [Thermomicrobiales bacterium]
MSTSTSTWPSTVTSTAISTNPNVNAQSFGIVVGASIQVLDALEAGVAVALGARIQNNANVPEAVNVVTTYACPQSGTMTIDQEQTTIPTNSVASCQTSWKPFESPP